MNIKDVYYVLRRSLPKLELHPSYYENRELDCILGPLNGFSVAIRDIIRVAPFLLSDKDRESVKVLLNSVKTDNDYSLLSTTKAKAEILLRDVANIRERTSDYIDHIERLIAENTAENEISVKLIHIRDLDDLEQTAKLLKLSFNIPLTPLGGHVEIGAVESGSVWIKLLIVGLAMDGLMLCANLIWSAVAIRAKIKEAEEAEAYLKRVNANQEIITKLLEHNVDYIKKIQDAEADHIVKEFTNGNNVPDIGKRVKTSIESIGTLLDKQAEFYPSLKAPEEVKMLFPKFGIKELAAASIKLLSEGKDDSPKD